MRVEECRRAGAVAPVHGYTHKGAIRICYGRNRLIWFASSRSPPINKQTPSFLVPLSFCHMSVNPNPQAVALRMGTALFNRTGDPTYRPVSVNTNGDGRGCYFFLLEGSTNWPAGPWVAWPLYHERHRAPCSQLVSATTRKLACRFFLSSTPLFVVAIFLKSHGCHRRSIRTSARRGCG